MIEKRSFRRVLVLPVMLTLVVVGSALAALGDVTTDGTAAPADYPHVAYDVAQLEGTVLHQSDELAAPTNVEVVGDELAILDAMDDQPVKTMRRSDGEITREFGRKGQGPGEFENVWSLDAINDHEMWIHDAMLSRITHVDLEADFSGASEFGDRILRLEANATVLDPIWIDNAIMTVGFFQRGRLGQLNARGHLVRTLGEHPMKDADVPPAVGQHAFQSKMEANPSRTMLAVATRHADRLEIYRTNGVKVAEGERPFGFEPAFEVVERGGQMQMASGSDLRFGYIDLATTEDRIYALFSGRTRAGYPGEANFGEYIHVYDWEGKLLEVHQLDVSAIAVAVDETGQNLYAIRHNPFPAVVAYLLP